MKLPIVTYPHPVLLRPADIVQFPLDESTRILIKDMWDTVRGEGVGLAAPQVGVSKRICVINMSESNTGEKARDVTLINPEITFESQIECLMVEGCLSFPDQYYEIWRPANIHVTYQDEQGRVRKLTASKWFSRIIQHEIGHLNGKLFINMGGRKLEHAELQHRIVVD